MSAKRLSMRKIREVLRLKYGVGLEDRRIAQCCRISHVSVGKYLARFKRTGLSWPLPSDLDDGQLEARLFGAAVDSRDSRRPLPDMAVIHRELRNEHVTLQLLWEEYRREHPDGYRYSQFCEHYRRWAKSLDITLRQEHRAGERMFTDFAGPTIPIYDLRTGEAHPAHLFVAVLGASNYTYAEATLTQGLPDWIGAHVRTFAYYGGVPRIVVPDNLKTGVSRACRYEPDLNPTYEEMARHYGTVVIPARPGKPKDKAKVEAAVLLVERWILAVLRHRRFFSLAELNGAIRELLERLNNRRFKKLPGTRAEWFLEMDAPALRPLPDKPFEFATYKKARVNIDYHVEVDGHYYSVHYRLIHQAVEVWLADRTVEILWRGKRVAAHARSFQKGKHTTVEEHRPKSHQRYLSWTPGRLIRWAQTVGEHCARVVQLIIESKPHPEQGYRSCLGLLRLSKGYGNERLEAACRRALTFDTCSYRSIKSILKAKLDTQPLPEEETATIPLRHENVRGQAYFEQLWRTPEIESEGNRPSWGILVARSSAAPLQERENQCSMNKPCDNSKP